MKKSIASVIPLILFTVCIYSQSGTLDRDFDADGIVITQVGPDHDQTEAIEIQPDGKILVAGYTTVDDQDLLIIRYNVDGSLDNTFGESGMVIKDIGDGSNYCESIALQSDGKIVAAGKTGWGSDFAIFRYNSDGSPDVTFNESGIVITDIYGDDYAYAIKVQNDGKIIVAGYTYTDASNSDFALVRYNANGTLDESFSFDGIVTTEIGGSYDRGYSLNIQSDGKIIVAGHAYSNDFNECDFSMARYNSDGTLDNTFGVNGIVITEIGDSLDMCYSSVIQSDGKIILAGYSNEESRNLIAVARYNTDGTLDNTFSVDGKVTTLVGVNSICNAVILQKDGKIVVGGSSYNGDDTDYALVRYNTDGTLDHSFDDDGKLTTDIGLNTDNCRAVAIQADNKIVAAGISLMGTDKDISLARYLVELNVDAIDFTIQSHSLLVYPNPIRNNAILEYELIKEETISINLYDMQGKLIQNIISEERKPAGSYEESLSIDSTVLPGIYYLVISNNTGTGNYGIQISIP